MSPADANGSLGQSQTFTVTGGYAAAGVGMRNRGYGTITMSAIPAGSQVQAAYLYWDILADTIDPTFAQGQFNSHVLTGTLIGTAGDPCWGNTANYAYRADVTSLVTGNGSYALAGFATGRTDGIDPWTSSFPAPMAEGASLVVIYANASSPSTQILVYDGSAEVEDTTASVTLSGFTAPPLVEHASTTFVVADGQTPFPGVATVNGRALPIQFNGTDPQAGPDYSNGNLWDTQTTDVASVVWPGSTSATVTLNGGDFTGYDCLVWVAQIFAVPTASSNPPVADYAIQHQCTACAANTAATGGPINVVGGNSWLQQTDLLLPGIGQSLDLVRSYNSVDATDTGFGVGWSWSYGLTITQPDDTSRLVRYADGRLDLYTSDGNGGFTPPAGTHNTLVQNADGSSTLTTPQQLVYAFDSTGRLTSQTDRNGNALTLAYSSTGVTVTAPGGRSVTLGYGTGADASHFVTLTENDTLARSVHYGYDAASNLTSVTDVGGGTTSFTYDGNHQLLTRTDPRNHTVETNVYDAQGRVIQQTDANNQVITLSYDPANQQTTVTDARNHAWVYRYDGGLLITSVTDPNGHTTSYTYDSDSNRTGVTDPNTFTTSYSYDSQGNVLTVVNPRGSITTYTYNNFGEPLTKTDALNQETIYGYDTHGNLTSLTDPANKTASATYAANGELLTVTDPNTHTLTYGYNASGDLTSITDALNHALTQTFDAGGRRLTQTDALTHTTTYAYDAFNHVLSLTDPNTHTTTFTYDADGNQLTRTDANTHTTSSSYDPMNQLLSLTDASSHTTNFSYDANGNQTSVTDATNRTTTYGFDAANQLISVTDNAGHTTSYTLDAAGRVTVVTDANNHATDYSYDAAGNLTTVVDALNEFVSYGYDAVNQLTSVDDANNHATTYRYDADGRPTGRTDALNHSWSVTYDDAGQLATATDANGHLTSYSHDAANRLTQISYFDGTSIVFGYDDANRQTSRTDSTGTTTFSYDAAGNLLSVTAPGSGTVSYTYDAANQETSLSYPSGHAVSYGYDPAGRLTSLTDWLNQVLSYGYDDAGRLARISDPNGVSAAYSYDPAGRLSEIVNTKGATTLLDLAYTRDGVGNPTQSTTSGPAFAWGYNFYGQLGDGTTTAQHTGETLSSPSNVRALAAGDYHSLFLTSDGTVWAVGRNGSGQLGDGTTSDRSTPVQVSGLTNVVAIAAGGYHSLALKSDGTVWAWGDNTKGQLGDGTTTDHSTPVQVSGLTDVVAIAGGGYFSLAVKRDGTVWAWGDNFYGEIGDGTIVARHTPVQVTSLAGVTVTAVAAGTSFSLALTSTGQVWAWGKNSEGQLGDGTTINRYTPVQVSGLTGVTLLAAGRRHSLARTSNGTVWAWGKNDTGELGDGTTTDRSSPVTVPGMSGVTSLAGGFGYSLAVKNDGTVWAWGDNLYGQLGDGTIVQRHAPVQATGLSGVAEVAAGAYHSLALFRAETTSYGYDAANRLTSASSSDGHTDTRVYDQVGNQTSVTIDGVWTTADYDAANEVTRFGTTAYTYDNNGNQLTATTGGQNPVTTTYGYDARNELVSISGPLTASYTFNGAGERVSKTVNGTTTRYTWDPTGLGTVIADGTVENVFGPAGLAEQVSDSNQTPQFAHADALGSIRLITDGSGTVVGTGSYGAWGTPDNGSVTLGGFGFTGEQVDPETDFVYLRNRYYDPATGRFLTPNPLGLAGSGVNLYAYVGNNPATLTDPSGLAGIEDPNDVGPAGGGDSGSGGGNVKPRVAPPAPEAPQPFIGPVLPEPQYPKGFIGPVLPEPPAGPFGLEGEGAVCPLQEESVDSESVSRRYDPSPKHDPNTGWDSRMDLDNSIAQQVLKDGYQSSGKQVYGYYNGKFYEFQPDNQGGYHGYPVPAGDVPTEYLRQLRDDGDISNAEYNRFRKEPRSKRKGY